MGVRRGDPIDLKSELIAINRKKIQTGGVEDGEMRSK